LLPLPASALVALFTHFLLKILSLLWVPLFRPVSTFITPLMGRRIMNFVILLARPEEDKEYDRSDVQQTRTSKRPRGSLLRSSAPVLVLARCSDFVLLVSWRSSSLSLERIIKGLFSPQLPEGWWTHYERAPANANDVEDGPYHY